MKRWFVASDPVLPAALLPAVLLDTALRRGVSAHRLLAGTRLFPDDLCIPGCHVSTAQVVRMLQNFARHDAGRDAFFRLGADAAPSALGPVAPLVASARSPRDALRGLVVYRRLWLPFVQIRTVGTGGHLWLLLDDGAGAGPAWRALVEVVGTALVETLRDVSGARPDATWLFPYAEPSHVEQYHEVFGTRLVFGAPITGIRFPRAWLDRALPGASPTRRRIARCVCAQLRRDRAPGPGFLEAVRGQLLREPRRDGALVPVATGFGMSPATFKRRLKEHDQRFQSLADQVALQRALELLLLRGRSPETAVRALGFSDPSNFRRAFKRWTGRRPLELVAEARRALAPASR